MVFNRKISLIVILTSVLVYRNQYTLRNSVLKTFRLPDGYYAGGDVTTDCELLDDPVNDAFKFCEDETFWDIFTNGSKLEERKVLVTCDANRKNWNTVMGPLRDPNPRGTLWVYSPHAKVQAEVGGIFGGTKTVQIETPVRPLRIAFENYPEDHDFHPLGIKVYPSYGGNASNIYVVNHAREKTFIEQFTISPSAPTVARHVRTLSHRSFVSPNALALTSPDSFYVTNDHFFTRRLSVVGHILPVIESLLALPLSWTAHVTLDPDPSSATPILSHVVVAPYVPFSNGIAISSNGQRVAIAATTLSQIRFYTRNTSTNALTFEQSAIVPFLPDNVDFDDTDTLVVAGHPNFPTLTKVVKGNAPYAASWVVALSLGEHQNALDVDAPLSASGLIPVQPNAAVKTLFQSNGAFFSTSTTGLFDSKSGQLYITGLYGEPGLVVCKPPQI